MTPIEPNPAVSALSSTSNPSSNTMPTPTAAPVATVAPVSPTAPATTPSPVVTPTTLPVVSLPSVPVGWTPIPLSEFRGTHPLTTEVVAAPSVVTELTGSTTYASTFGPLAPDLAKLLQSLGDACGWSNVRMALDTYLLYVKVQEALAWQVARPQLDDLKSLYDLAVSQNANVATEFQALTRLVNLRSGVAHRAAATKKKVQKAKVKAAASATSTAPSTVPATPAATAPATPTATANTTGAAGH